MVTMVTHTHTHIYIYMCVCELPLFVTLKKVYDRNVVNKYGLYLLLGVIIYNIIDYIYIYIYINKHSADIHKVLQCNIK